MRLTISGNSLRGTEISSLMRSGANAPTAGLKARLIAQRSSASWAVWAIRISTTPFTLAIFSICSACFLISYSSEPSTSVTMQACTVSGKSNLRFLAIALRQVLSISSAEAGTIPACSIWWIVSQAPSNVANINKSVLRNLGIGIRRRIALVTIPKVPSEPTISCVILYPVTFLIDLPPVFMILPSARTTSKPITKLCVTPYLTARIPPASSAILPPIVENLKLAGSGG
ncbi:hypothetical protein SDC9_145247 [bioreactor metagenome]|uniref:Uncharacterized protein n=1 Tax=bioreactor metagenome TaxID=1076179 RepID=A0A645E8Z1_9ZZZZ